MSYVSSDNQKSSMRLNFILLTVMSCILLLAVAFYICLKVLKAPEVQIDWSGMGVFVGLLLGGMSGMGFAKAQQKRYEVNDK